MSQKTDITKERRCVECGCNTLRQTQYSDTASAVKWRSIAWYCMDCDEEVKTELVGIGLQAGYMESNSKKIARLERQLANARANIKRMSDAADARLRKSLD